MQPQNTQFLPAPRNPGEKTSSLRDILYVLFLRKKAFLIFFGVVFLGVAAYTYLCPESYQSEAKVLVRLGRESLSLDPTVNGPTVSLSQTREDEVNSELAMMKSRYLAEQVVDKITPAVFLAAGETSDAGAPGLLSKAKSSLKQGWRHIFPLSERDKEEAAAARKEAAIDSLTNNLAVDVEQKSHVITVSFASKNPAFSRKVLSLFLQTYQEHHIQVHRSQAPPQFFRDQADRLNDELKKKENQLEAFRTSHHIASVDIQKEKLFTQISKIQGDIAEMNSQVAASKAHNAALEKGLAAIPREVVLNRVAGRKDTTADTIKSRLFDFRVKEADLSARYPDDNRELMEVRQQIRLAETALRNERHTDEVTTGVDPTYQNMKLALETGRAQLKGQMASLKTLQEDLKKPQAELADLVKNEIVEGRMQRDAKLLADEYVRYRQDMQRTIISKDLDSGKVSNLSFIQPATLPLEPIKPKKTLNIALGFFLALFGGVSLAFFVEYLDDSLKTREDVENRLGLPVLASIPCEEGRSCT